jgi:hypothetical protein
LTLLRIHRRTLYDESAACKMVCVSAENLTAKIFGSKKYFRLSA